MIGLARRRMPHGARRGRNDPPGRGLPGRDRRGRAPRRPPRPRSRAGSVAPSTTGLAILPDQVRVLPAAQDERSRSVARKRVQPTTEILSEIVARLGPSPRAVDLDALRAHLALPEFGGDVDEARVARALRAMKANRAFAETGVDALRRAVPALRATVSGGQAIAWTVRVAIPLLDDGRLELRVDAPADAAAIGILRGMAHRNDPKWRVEELRAGGDPARRPDHRRAAPARGAPSGADPSRSARGRGRRVRLHRTARPLAAITAVSVRRRSRLLAVPHPHPGAQTRQDGGAPGFPSPASPGSRRIRRVHRKIHRGAPAQPAHPVPHGPHQLGQDLRRPHGADRGRDRHLPRAPAAPGAGELRGAAGARLARRHGHGRGGAGRGPADPHRAHDRDGGPDAPRRRRGDRRDPDALRSGSRLGLDQRAVRGAGQDRHRVRVGRRPGLCPARRRGGGRVAGGHPLRAQDAARPLEAPVPWRRSSPATPSSPSRAVPSTRTARSWSPPATAWRRSTAPCRRRCGGRRPPASAPARRTCW